MVKWLTGSFIVTATVITIMSACAPKAAPVPAAPVAASSAGPAAAPKISPVVSSEEAAWAKVLEAAKKEGKVSLYSYSFVGDIGIAAQRAFKEKYSITVELVTGRGAEFIERLKTEQRIGSIMADLLDGSPTHLTSAKAMGLTVEAYSGIPNLQEKGVWLVPPLEFHDPAGHVLPYNFFLYSTFVNTNLVKPESYPRTLKDLLGPQWKGKMMIPDPRLSTGSYLLFVPLVNHKVVGWDYAETLGKQDLRFSTGFGQEINWLAKGERELSLTVNASSAGDIVAQGAPVKAIPMEEGMVAGGLASAIIKGGPHPNAARVFLNWLLSQEGQQLVGRVTRSGSIRKDVADYTPEGARLQAKRIIVPTPEDIEQQAKLFREGFITKMWQLK